MKIGLKYAAFMASHKCYNCLITHYSDDPHNLMCSCVLFGLIRAEHDCLHVLLLQLEGLCSLNGFAPYFAFKKSLLTDIDPSDAFD